VLAERSLLARLEAGCAAPVGAHALVEEAEVSLTAVVARVDGVEQLTHSARAPLPVGGTATPSDRDDVARALGVRVADALLADGAARLAPLRETGVGAASGPSEDRAVETAREQLRDGGYRGEVG